jgi:hypothetical protein
VLDMIVDINVRFGVGDDLIREACLGKATA